MLLRKSGTGTGFEHYPVEAPEGRLQSLLIDGASFRLPLDKRTAIVGVGGNHVESQNSRGAVAVSGPRREVSHEDVERATEVARAVTIPSNREVLHVLPRGFVVDGQEGVKDPLGMSAVRLEVETHIVHASATAVQNLSKCVQRADVRIDELVAASLASADAVLTETERELGVAVADFGAGTIDQALFLDGSPFHVSVLPLGGNNVTNDVAIGLKTSLAAAEMLKIHHGTADPNAVGRDDEVSVEGIGESDGRMASRLDLANIIEARMREVFEKIGEEIERAGNRGMLPAGLVLTGGAAQLAGTAELGRDLGGDLHARGRQELARLLQREGEVRLADLLPEHAGRQRAPADVAEADEHDPDFVGRISFIHGIGSRMKWMESTSGVLKGALLMPC